MKQGDYAILTAKSKIWGDGNMLQEIRDHKYVGIIQGSEAVYNDQYSFPKKIGIKYVHVEYTDLGIPITVTIESEFVKLVTKKEYDECVEKISQSRKRLIKELIPKRQSLLLRNVDHGQKQNLNTNTNFVNKGTWNVKTNNFTIESRLYNQVCCAFSRSLNDYQFFIPDFWLKYYGYTKVDLKRWLEFIKGCDIDFNYSYDGLVSNPQITPRFSISAVLTANATTLKNAIIVPDDQFHQVNMKGSNTAINHTYLRFILVRYLYNNQYWSIAVRAVQIKKALGTKVSNWQALLMAHCTEAYNPYYALWGAGSSTRTDLTSVTRQNTNIINIKKATAKSILELLTSLGASMNASFPVTTLDTDKYDKFVRAQDWEAFYDVLKKNAII